MKAGIPVVLYSGLIEADTVTTEIHGGAGHFGNVMGDFLVKELNGQGNIWSFVDLAGHSEDTHGCNGPIQASREPT